MEINKPNFESSLNLKQKNKWYMHKGVIAIGVLFVLTLGLSYLSLNKNNSIQQNPNIPLVSENVVSSEMVNEKFKIKSEPFSKDFDKYGLFLNSEFKIISIEYYDHGTVESGPYINYSRVLAAVQFDEPGGPTIFLLMTKDFKTFILDKKYEADYESAENYFNFNKSKIISTGTVPLIYPPNLIDLGELSLEGGDFAVNVKTNKEITSSVSGFKFWTNLNDDTVATTSILSPDYYLAESSQIYLQDKYGIYFSYNLVSKELLERRIKQEYNNNFYIKSEIETNEPLFSVYGKLIPLSCGSMNEYDVLKNVTVDDLTKIGTTVKGTDIFVLKDKYHPLYKEQYNAKVLLWKDEFKILNNIEPPSYISYVAKNPILIFKDSWNRWVGLGELEFLISVGCGKPVLYFYPTKPTEVSVKFKNPVHFTVDIPKYNNGWKILAMPDGSLKDLKTELTDCFSINSDVKGAEYAFESCNKNLYPYLYWAGQTVGNYPTANKGWVVARQDIKNFLEDKLSIIGLNEKEKADMVEYWVPHLLKKDSPYYRVSFFLTKTMNDFIPMEISPKPDTFIRVFLDWSELQSFPNEPLEPQTLKHTHRTGFTVVEWGGIK